ncbi:Hypothetical predicted protein [Lecanosticta acicola]|uniref:Uncharacterized protein n=1 Tax=Lecanosticta acicola TaxID=111012 RepID=A0AAI9EB80_9PEZI|nr:Hypothetical predicted protein [Lecanosticta acicola]
MQLIRDEPDRANSDFNVRFTSGEFEVRLLLPYGWIFVLPAVSGFVGEWRIKNNKDLEGYVRERCRVPKVSVKYKTGKYDVDAVVHRDSEKEKAYREHVKKFYQILKERVFRSQADGKLGDKEELELIEMEEGEDSRMYLSKSEKAVATIENGLE